MELELANQYIINDSDRTLINTHQLIRDNAGLIKKAYNSLVIDYKKSVSKRDFYLSTIRKYNECNHLDGKSLLLPFIINHSWSGIIYHDKNEKISYREVNIDGEIVPGYLEDANLTVDQFSHEVDRVSQLLNSNNVIFESGDFQKFVEEARFGDLVVLNPPYPENKNVQTKESGMYLELYSQEQLYTNLLKFITQMEKHKISYILTYGFYNPAFKDFVIHDDQVNNFFRILGYDNCAWGIALDQLYYSADLKIPADLKHIIIPAKEILERENLTSEQALEKFKNLARNKISENIELL